MAMPWYEWGNIIKKLISFGKAMQGISPYRVLVEADILKCRSGYCDFSNQEIAVNPALFPKLQPKDQYQLTKALLVHEAGHRRFTDPKELPPIIQQVANILEDERIERQMRNEFAGVRWLLTKLSKQLYKETKPIDETTDNPGEVIAYFLQLRWAAQIGKPVKGSLSAKNQDLWEKVKSLVFAAWEAETFDLVCKNAAEIVRILGFKIIVIPAWAIEILRKLGSLKGKRIDGDFTEITGGVILKDKRSKSEEKPEPFDGEVLPNKSRAGKGSEAIPPKPYLELEERVKPLVKELIDELIVEEKPINLEPEERGGRFSVREYIRDESRPFLCEEGFAKTPPTINLKIIVDHSTSLNYGKVGRYTRIESMVQAIMTLHLVCLELGTPHEVIVTPQQVIIADLESGERGKALIAGLSPALCDYEDMGLAIKNHALPMQDYEEDIKIALCLTDGACNDAELGKEICRALRGKVEVIGVLLDPDNHTKSYLFDMFGKDRVIACKAEQLPQKLGNVLRSIRGR